MTLLSQDKATKPDLLIRALPEIYENLQPQKNKDKE
jgi:phosphoglycolate phosphatase